MVPVVNITWKSPCTSGTGRYNKSLLRVKKRIGDKNGWLQIEIFIFEYKQLMNMLEISSLSDLQKANFDEKKKNEIINNNKPQKCREGAGELDTEEIEEPEEDENKNSEESDLDKENDPQRNKRELEKEIVSWIFTCSE